MLQTFLISKLLGSLIRHGVGAAGGAILASGIADAATTEAITGGLMAASSVLLSMLEKARR